MLLILFTRIGREILKILSPKEHVAVLERIFESISGQITHTRISTWVNQAEYDINCNVVKVLK